jgi:hypothetical protein
MPNILFCFMPLLLPSLSPNGSRPWTLEHMPLLGEKSPIRAASPINKLLRVALDRA